MIRNLFFAIVGAVVGVLLFRWARRKVDAVIAETAPDAMAARAARGVARLGEQVADFVDDVRTNTRRREAELRAELGMADVIRPEPEMPPPSFRRYRPDDL